MGVCVVDDGRVDTYGAGVSRDICPTVEGGDVYYNIMSSCIRVARLQLANPGLLTGGCNVANEVCCQYNQTMEGFQNVWSLRQSGGADDTLLTADANELNTLIKNGWGTEVRYA